MLLVGGENLFDMVQSGEQDGLPQYTAVPGGSPYNLALAAARQGVQTNYMTPISDSRLGSILADRLTDEGVSLLAERNSAPNSLAVVTLIGGSPTYSFYRNGTAERMITWEDLTSHDLTEQRIFHVGSLGLTGGEDADLWARFAGHCKSHGLVFSLDPNVRASLIDDPESYRERMRGLLEIADILKLSDEDLEFLYQGLGEDEALAKLLENTKASVLVLTRGEQGSQVRHDGSWIHVPVAPVETLVDTVGAGDTYMASMLAWLMDAGKLDVLADLNADDKTAMAKHAAAAAAINCGRQGCNPPRANEIS